MVDPDVADAMARSFLGKLPSDLLNELLAEGDRTDYPTSSSESPRSSLNAHSRIG